MMRAWIAVAGLGVVLSACSSTSTCNRDEDAITVPKTDAIIDAAAGSYLSAPYHDPNKPLVGTPYAYFPPARTITFEHDLGVMLLPDVPQLAFSDHGSVAPSAGNEAITVHIDENSFSIKNDTCSDFYIWVSAHRAPENSSSGSPGGAEESAGAGGSTP
ncbi:MAG: hypothetical protein ABJB12_04770 [Pseudomonadota bacterium]